MRLSVPLATLIVLGCGGAAHAAPPVRLITANTAPDFDRKAVTQVVSVSGRQKGDPRFNVMASKLGDALSEAGLNVQQDATAPDVYVLFEYKALSIPFFRRYGSTSDSAYRAVVVTGLSARAWREAQQVRVLWQTAFDQPGTSADEETVIPPLLLAGRRWYGRNLTPKGLGAIARCPGDAVSTGSHLAGGCFGRDSPAAGILSVISPTIAAPG